jgi:hypothetical protein
MYYPYISFAFYFGKLAGSRHEIVLIEKTKITAPLFQKARESEPDNFDVVLYHLAGDEIPQIQDSHGFAEEQIFKNDAHTLIVYQRTSTAEK